MVKIVVAVVAVTTTTTDELSIAELSETCLLAIVLTGISTYAKIVEHRRSIERKQRFEEQRRQGAQSVRRPNTSVEPTASAVSIRSWSGSLFVLMSFNGSAFRLWLTAIR